MSRGFVGGLAAVLLLAGCAPGHRVELGFREVPTNVLLGASPTPTAGPAGSLAPLPAVPPGVVSLPPPAFPPAALPGPTTLPVPVSAPTTCPSADPLAAPAVVAPAIPSGPPATAAYRYRNDGGYTTSGAAPRSGRFPLTTVRSITHVLTSPQGYSYDVVERLVDTVTTTGFSVLLTGSTTTAAGVYLTGVSSRRDDGTTSSFSPVPALQLAGLPFVQGSSVTARAVDPRTQTVESFTATVKGKARVDACGTPLDSWRVDLTNGQVLSPTENLTFAATYQFGTQFGAVSLRDLLAFQGTDSSGGVSRTDIATIDSVPRTR